MKRNRIQSKVNDLIGHGNSIHHFDHVMWDAIPNRIRAEDNGLSGDPDNSVNRVGFEVLRELLHEVGDFPDELLLRRHFFD